MPIDLYCGLCETKWNEMLPSPGKLVCISPVYGTGKKKKENRVLIQEETEKIIVDSGAFSDNVNERLTPEDALKRQIAHISKYEYLYKVYKVATYDILIDEKWHNERRSKQRWSEEEAEFAVKETIKSATYLDSKRYAIPNEAGIVMNIQGVSTKQYIMCAENILKVFNTQTDTIGLGGWCIVGKMRRRMMGSFIETTNNLMPILKDNNVKNIHIWGVVFPNALGHLLYLCNKYEIALSTDSVGPQLKPCFGAWGYGDWTNNNYERPDVSIRGSERKKHLDITRDWLHNFENTQYYKDHTGKQIEMF